MDATNVSTQDAAGELCSESLKHLGHPNMHAFFTMFHGDDFHAWLQAPGAWQCGEASRGPPDLPPLLVLLAKL
jgi:hypothetical protein